MITGLGIIHVIVAIRRGELMGFVLHGASLEEDAGREVEETGEAEASELASVCHASGLGSL